MFRKYGVAALSLGLLLIACGGDTSQNQTGIINPNGDSELALLMRAMFEDGMLTKQQILNRQLPEIKYDYTRIHTAEATQPEKVATIDFKLFAKAYEASASALLTSGTDNRAEAYQAMVAACMQCHQTMCPGPIVKIKKMYLSEEEVQALSQ